MDNMIPSPEQIEQEQWRQIIARKLAKKPLEQFDRGLITIEELAERLAFDVVNESHRKLFKREVNRRCEHMVGLTPDLMGDWDEAGWFDTWRETTFSDDDWRDLLYHIFVECNDMDEDDFGNMLAAMQRTL